MTIRPMTVKEKAENYSRGFFFSTTPLEWSFEELLDYLRKSSEDTTYEMACELNHEDDLAAWEVFEEYNPHWLADQVKVMAQQLEDRFK
ncbi:hypothetical protein UFOVP11_53 [uncultured Caudovirales phage]|uniref:Uncharacterized protein n=1 Tax=uncultured Caudovirales phage TaxID=2100421 RepID=A0A6J5KMQ0_9CAUD|nr:hypothetical protein UFOVP11_53 [uncultured Caudovirales phage]